MKLGEAEQVFLIHGVQEGVRNDGRSGDDYRPMCLETSVLANTSGSARLRLANTDILVGVKAELEAPSPDTPDCGRIQFFLDCSANATPEFEGRGGQELSNRLISILTSAYNKSKCVDLKRLCVHPNTYCWVLYIDILLLEFGGNVCDAVSLCVKAALHNTVIPKVSLAQTAEKDKPDVELTDDRELTLLQDLSLSAPVIVTVNKIGWSNVVDTTAEEESCVKAAVVVACTQDGTITLVRQQGKGSLEPDSLNEMLDTGVRVGKKLNQTLLEKLKSMCDELME